MTTPCDCWTEEVWRPIHTMARVSSVKENEEKAAFCTLILCVNRIISCPTIEREVLAFMENPDNDMMKYVTSNERLFSWTVFLRAHINKALNKETTPTLTELTEYYNPKTLTKDIWGPQHWKFMHNTMLRVPLQDGYMSPRMSIACKSFLTCMAILLPCTHCRKHAWEYFSSHAINAYLDTNLHAFEWTVNFHNEVSQRLNEQHGTRKLLYKPYDALHLYVTLPSDVNFQEKFYTK